MLCLAILDDADERIAAALNHEAMAIQSDALSADAVALVAAYRYSIAPTGVGTDVHDDRRMAFVALVRGGKVVSQTLPSPIVVNDVAHLRRILRQTMRPKKTGGIALILNGP